MSSGSAQPPPESPLQARRRRKPRPQEPRSRPPSIPSYLKPDRRWCTFRLRKVVHFSAALDTNEAVAAYHHRLVAAISGSRRSIPFARTRLVWAVAAICALMLSGVALALRDDLLNWDVQQHARFDPSELRPAPASSFSTVTQGNDWALIAWKSERGICVDYVFVDTRNRAGYNLFSSCGSTVIGSPPDRVYPQPPPTSHVNAMVGQGSSPEQWIICGPVAPDVARIEMKMSDGSEAPVDVLRAPAQLDSSLRFFVYRGATGRVDPQTHQIQLSAVAVIAYDSSGAVLQTVPVAG